MHVLQILLIRFLPPFLLIPAFVAGTFSLCCGQTRSQDFLPTAPTKVQKIFSVDKDNFLVSGAYEEVLLSGALSQSVANTQRDIDYKAFVRDVIKIFKWMDKKDVTFASFLSKFTNRDSCEKSCFYSLSSNPETQLSALESSEYINVVEFELTSNGGKNLVPNYLRIVIKREYYDVFSVSKFYKEILGYEIPYRETNQRVNCDRISEEKCPKNRQYFTSIKKKHFPNSNPAFKYSVDAFISRTEKTNTYVSILLAL